MDVSAGVVRVPYLHVSVSNRASTAVEDLAAQISNRADSRRDGAVDHQKVVVCIQRQRDRIIGTLGLLRRGYQSLRECARHSHESARNTCGAKLREKCSAVRYVFHAVDWTDVESFRSFD